MTTLPVKLGKLSLKDLVDLKTRAEYEIEQRQQRCEHRKTEFTLLQHCQVDILVEDGEGWVSNDDYDHEIQAPFSVKCFHCGFSKHYTNIDHAPAWVKQQYEVARDAKG